MSSAPRAAAASSGSQRLSDAGQNHLRFGIAEPDVELDDLGPVGGQHQADVEKPAERMSLGRHSRDHRIDDLTHHTRVQRSVDQRAWGERAHAAGVRPVIVVEDALVVLRGADRQRPRLRRSGRRTRLRVR